MTRTVTSITNGYSNSALPIPYAYAKLSCGHVHKVELRPHLNICASCDDPTEVEVDFGKRGGDTCESCGGRVWRTAYTPNPHNEADRLTKVGDVVTCAECVSEDEAAKRIEQIDPATIHHVRPRRRSYYFYRLDPTSPSNFRMVTAAPICQKVEEVIQRKGFCGVSPTEPA